jgi:hypothetical protein
MVGMAGMHHHIQLFIKMGSHNGQDAERQRKGTETKCILQGCASTGIPPQTRLHLLTFPPPPHKVRAPVIQSPPKNPSEISALRTKYLGDI